MPDARAMDVRLRELERRVARLIQIGVVTETDPANQRVRVDILGEDRESHWLPVATTRAGDDRTWWPPSEGEQVLVWAPRGNPVLAVVGLSLYQADFPAPGDSEAVRRTQYASGTSVALDQDENRLRVEHEGDVEIEATGTVKIHAAGDLELAADGNVTITGNRVDINP